MSTEGRLKWYSPNKFKETFKVGDLIVGNYGKPKTILITAIGRTRFLGITEDDKEAVYTQAQTLGWEKVPALRP